MRARLRSLALLLAAWPAWAVAADPDLQPSFPTAPPVRERVLNVDDHAPWTLRKGEGAVPLVVAPTPERTVVGLAGGWLVLGPDLEFQAGTLDFLGPGAPAGSPWAQAVDGAVVFVAGSPGDLAVLYPDPAVVVRQALAPADLSHFAVTDDGLFYVQGRRASASSRWSQTPRETQPLPFFPADVTSASDGTAWAADSLQARPWRQEGGFWKPLDFPKAPGRLTSLSPFPDSTGYFAGGPGWVGAFSSDGTAFWLRDKDFAGQPLPRDLRLRAGAGRLYLWSPQARKVWSWAWTSEGLAGTVGAPSFDRLPDLIRSELDRLEALGSLPEAQDLAQYGVDLAQSVLRTQPFHQLWSRAAAEFAQRRQALRTRIVGAGVFTVFWTAPWGRPLASWTWEPDADWTDVKAWRVAVKPYWEGRPWDPDDFRLALVAEDTPWPGAEDYQSSDLQLPSWMNLEFRPDGSDAPVHWARVALPEPPAPYDLPVE